MKIYHNPRCSKSRETLKIIEDAGKQVEIIEYLKSIPTEKELIVLIRQLGIPAATLIRKGEAIYKEQFKDKNLTEDQWIKAMIEFPKLIERPIIVKGNRAILGRPPQNVEVFL
jgi:arsenate reductase